MNFASIIKERTIMGNLSKSVIQLWKPNVAGAINQIILGFVDISSGPLPVLSGETSINTSVCDKNRKKNTSLRELGQLMASNLTGGLIISRGSHGQPVFPSGWIGSFSHSNSCVSVIALNDENRTVGIDTQNVVKKWKMDWRSRVLTANELKYSSSLTDNDVRMMDATIRFSVKESFFKAVSHLQNHRYIGFKEIEVVLDATACSSGTFINLIDDRLKVLEGKIQADWIAFRSPMRQSDDHQDIYVLSLVQVTK